MIRRRGTAIVDTPKGILVAASKNGVYLLPGGEAESWETRTDAAIRELKEETGLIATKTKFLFRHLGYPQKSYCGGKYQNHHTVVLIQAKGIAVPKSEISRINYYFPGSNIKISGTTREIINRYYKLKNNK